MLKHESQEQPTATPAAQIRVTSEELAQAINALEASRDEAARHLAGTVPIGEVVQELKLEATPEEVWAQVQTQRAQKAAEAAAAQAAAAQKEQATAAQALAAAQATQAAQVYARPRRRGRWWMVFGIGWAVYGIAHGSFLHPHRARGTQGAVIGGDNQTLTSGTQGKDVEVTGDGDTLTLQGNCPTLTVSGDGNHIRVEGAVGRVIIPGDGNTVVYTQGAAPALSGHGDGNQIGPSAP